MDPQSDGNSSIPKDTAAAVESLQQTHLDETEADEETNGKSVDDQNAVQLAVEDHRNEVCEGAELSVISEPPYGNHDDTDSDSTFSDGTTRPSGEKADSLLIEASSHKEEGNEHFKQGSLEMAARSYRRGCQAIKSLAHSEIVDEQVSALHLALHTNLSMVLFQLQKHQQSMEVASKALKLQPNNIKAFYRRAVAYRAMGRLEKAKSDLQSALLLDAKNVSCRRELQAIQLDLQASKENERKSLAKAFSGKLAGGRGGLLYEDKEIEERKRKQLAEQRKKREQEQYKNRKQQWEDECVKRMAKNEPAISFEDWEKEEKEKEMIKRKEEESKRKEHEKQRNLELKAKRAQQQESGDDSDDSEINEKELAMMRGYKLTKDGRKTSYFTRELPEDARHQYQRAIAPKRLDSNGDQEWQESASASSHSVSTPLSTTGAVTSAWNTAGTWEEKDTTSWCTSQLRKRLKEITITGEKYDADIVEVKNISGHASVAFAAGKKRYIFEYEADLKYEVKGHLDDALVASGSVKLPDIESASHDELEVIFGTWKKRPASEFQDVALEARRHLAQQLRLQVLKWVEDFNSAY